MKLLLVIAVGLLAAGCAGASAPAPRSAVAITALETKATMSGCTPSTQPLTLAVATCSYGSGSVTLGTFDSPGHRDLWVLAQKSAADGIVVKGADWALTTLDGQDATTLATALGGTVG